MSENSKWNILLDLDDTLVPNTHLYHAPSLRCCLLISEALGVKSVHPSDLLQAHLEIDMAMVRTLGYSVERYPTSWVRTYEKMARRMKLPIDRKVCARLLRTAAAFAKGPYVPYEGAKETLMELQRDGHELHLVTAGDKALQERKIRACGLSSLLDSVNITGVDKKPVMAKIARERKDRTMMVGDSLKSDIKPAVELGLTAVHVPSHTWAYANAEVDRRKYRTIRSIDELPALIRALERRRASGRAARRA
ncbi:MAG TPA: HAD family hydrolase [Candidatus Binatia bacterium]|nr:HAD family hydrolase [Candidatus Binatia bacterium]